MAAGYKLRIPDKTADLIKNLHPVLKRRVKVALKTILNDPFSGKALKDELKDLKSFKVRRFRVIYRISSKTIIELVAVGPRKNIYEETFKLITKEQSQK